MAFSVLMPKLGMIMTEGTVAKWFKRHGDKVETGEPLLEIQSDKYTFEVTSQSSGSLHLLVVEGQTAPVEAPLAYILAPGEAPPDEAATRSSTPLAGSLVEPQAVVAAATAGEPIRATPVARRLAREMGIDLAKVKGTGPDGRITEEDVRRLSETMPRAPHPAERAIGQPEVQEVISLKGVRGAIAQRMLQSLQASAQYTLSLEVDMTEAVSLRRQAPRGESTRISTTDIIVKAVAEALKRHPRLNSALVGNELHVFRDINIGVAVALSEGLVVPVIRNADKKSLEEIGIAVQDVTRRARENQLTMDDSAGGTFTISVLGTVDTFTPIINPPQCAILGVGRIVEKPAIHHGQIAVRSMVTLSLTVDHRAIDGAPAASFLRRLSQLLERPSSLFGKASPETEPGDSAE